MRKHVTVRIRLDVLLVLVLILVLLITGVVLYKNYIFHDLFFACLTADSIESADLCYEYSEQQAPLTAEETEELAALLRNVRFRGEPYKNVELLGDDGVFCRMVLKTGMSFTVKVLLWKDGLLVTGENAYPVADLSEPDAPESKNIIALEALLDRFRANHFPN